MGSSLAGLVLLLDEAAGVASLGGGEAQPGDGGVDVTFAHHRAAHPPPIRPAPAQVLRQAAVLLGRRGWYMAGTAHHSGSRSAHLIGQHLGG
jgi:acyl-coenzyme A thioesterase PaaI-like protein